MPDDCLLSAMRDHEREADPATRPCLGSRLIVGDIVWYEGRRWHVTRRDHRVAMVAEIGGRVMFRILPASRDFDLLRRPVPPPVPSMSWPKFVGFDRR